MYTFCYDFLLFFIYAVAGWIMETICCWIGQKKLTNRGFLVGPYCPIYGFGGLIMTLCLYRYERDIPVLFCMSMFLCSILEYFTSWIMEKMFHARWWDYSHKRFNVEGRICLTNAILFGVLGIFVVHFISPFLMHSLDLISHQTLITISIVFMVFFFFDVCLSFCIVNHLKNTISKVIREDSTAEITAKVKEMIKEKAYPIRRLFSAFPNIKIIPHIKKK